MKKYILSILLGLFVFTSYAQTNNSDIELFQSVFKSEKKMMITEYMKLSDTESAAFWEVYNAYEADRAELGKQRITLLQEYADNYESMNDESAADLLNKANSFQTKLNKIKTKYSKKMVKAVGAKKALQWIQFEEYLDRVIGLAIMENLPFVGEYN